MGLAVVTVAAGGMPVVDVTGIAPRTGLPVTEAANKFGVPVTKVAALGMPVVFETIGVAPPLTFNTTWNSADKTGTYTFSNGNLTVTTTSASGAIRGTAGYTGKFYLEYTLGSANFDNYGLSLLSVSLATFNVEKTGSVTLTKNNGNVVVGNTNSGTTLGVRATGEKIGIAVDTTGGLIWFRVSPAGNWNGSGAANPATGVGGVNISSIIGALYPIYWNGSGTGSVITANFGASAFVGAVPSGFAPGVPS